jgi:hypothetical protein
MHSYKDKVADLKYACPIIARATILRTLFETLPFLRLSFFEKSLMFTSYVKLVIGEKQLVGKDQRDILPIQRIQSKQPHTVRQDLPRRNIQS